MAASHVPSSATLSTAGAWQLLQLHRPELALTMSNELLARNPANVAAHLARTEALRQLKRLPEAAEAARTVVALAPQHADAFLALAQVIGQQGQLGAAEAAIREALRLDPIPASYHAFLAQLLYLQGHPRQAIASANAGLRTNPRHLDCLLWRALAQEQADQPDQADTDFQLLFRLAPDSALAHTRRGKQLLWRCDPEGAAAHLAEALRLAPTNSLELVPLLRRARREQYWPGWLRRHQWQLRQERSLGIASNLPSYFVSLVLPWYRARSWWLTRRDPLFRYKLPSAGRGWLWARYWAAWLLSICIFGYICLLFDWPPFLAIIPTFFILRKIRHRLTAR